QGSGPGADGALMIADLLRLGVGAASAFLALLFARAALHKVADVPGFEGVLASYGLAPLGLVAPGARILPAAELLCVALLVVPATQSAGATLAVALLGLYAGAMAFNLAQGRTLLDCGCGGAPLALSWALVARNAALIAAALPVAAGLGRAADWREGVAAA